MNDGELIRAVLPRNTMKQLARMMNVPIDTARHWLYRNLSNARRQELAEKLLKQLDDDDRRRAAARQTLQRIVNGDDWKEPS